MGTTSGTFPASFKSEGLIFGSLHFFKYVFQFSGLSGAQQDLFPIFQLQLQSHVSAYIVSHTGFFPSHTVAPAAIFPNGTVFSDAVLLDVFPPLDPCPVDERGETVMNPIPANLRFKLRYKQQGTASDQDQGNEDQDEDRRFVLSSRGSILRKHRNEEKGNDRSRKQDDQPHPGLPEPLCFFKVKLTHDTDVFAFEINQIQGNFKKFVLFSQMPTFMSIRMRCTAPFVNRNFLRFLLWFGVLLPILFSARLSFGQNPEFPKDYFRSPVDFRLSLSATFGEFRSDHFHSGIDIRTGGVEGRSIYSIADGYISRIKITSSGYGKAIYVTHPNGFVSVYGHLRDFNPAVRQYVIEKQYDQRSYEIDVFPDREMFPVTKGQVIASSGNSGYSFGPHLHFEIRDDATQQPLNPLLFGLPVNDLVKPVITSLKVYAMDDYSTIDGKTDTIVIAAEKAGQRYTLAGQDTLKLKGKISFGLQTYDLLSDSDRKYGIYSVELLMDDERIFKYTTTTFSFEETRYVNSVYDYSEYKKNSRRYIRTAIDPNNKFSEYDEVKENGIIYFDDDKIYDLIFIVKDVQGNTSHLEFYAKGMKVTSIQPFIPFPDKFDSFHFMYYLPNSYETDDFKVEIPSGALYTDLVLQYATAGPWKNTVAKVHKVHNRFTPLHKSMTLRIKPLEKAKGLEDKLYMVQLDENGKADAIRSSYEDGFVVGKSARFGNFSLMVDTIRPVIKPVNFTDKKSLAGMKQLKVEIKDDQSGIESYNPTLNGEWILMEYDEKNNLLIYDFDRYLLKGSNVFRLEVTDRKNNTRVYQATVTY